MSWAAALLALLGPRWVSIGLALVVAALSLRMLRRRSPRLAWMCAALAVLGCTLVRVDAVQSSPVRALAQEQASVRLVLVTTSDPIAKQGRFGGYVLLRAQTREVVGRGLAHRARAPVLVIADSSWRHVRLGSTVRVRGRLAAADDRALAGVLSAGGRPEVVAGPGALFRAADTVRAGVRSAMQPHEQDVRTLVPALVDGDDAGMAKDVVENFRVTGMTHLLAVSGTNLTLVVGFVLILARWAGVRARGLIVVGALGVVGFVILARTEPSVVRAAAMGTVGLIGMGTGGRRSGIRALGVAVFALMLFDPWLAVSWGFALSASATAGILVLAPSWRDALMRWLPRGAAEAVAVPLAAQVACTPLVAALSGQVSLVAVVANLLVAAAVAPATVLGLLGGLVAIVWEPLGQVVAAPAGWAGWWIISVARHCADLPVPAMSWAAGPVGLLSLTLLCVLVVLAFPRLLARPGMSLSCCALLAVAMLVPMPTPGWPPRDWVMIACDIGQGDGLLLNAGQGSAVVVDTGPDPRLMDGCLRRMGVRRIPLIVLTHFHADHVDGLAGALHGREVGEIEVTSLADPLSASRKVRALAARARVPVRIPAYSETRSIGPIRWQVLAPSGDPPVESGSPPNDASIVMYVETRGVRIPLMGDEEPPSQERLAALVPGLRVDVLKVAHHGSANQDDDLVESLGARLAVISCGVDNDYGHPASSTLRLLRKAGMFVRRTDRDGDVAVIARGGRLLFQTHKAASGGVRGP